MQGITLHDTETEEIIGTVTSETPIDFDILFDEVHRTWVLFNSEPSNIEDYVIEDFIDYHNSISDIIIDYIVMDFIQL